MRNCILILYLLVAIHSSAKVKDTVLHRVIFQTYGTIFVPTGSFSANDGNGYFLGQAKNGIGFNPSVLIRVHRNIYTGIYLNFDFFWLDREKLCTKAIEYFKEPGYYTSANKGTPEFMKLISYGTEFSYKFKTSLGDVEPYVHVGMATINNAHDNFYRTTTVYRKKKDDNYYEKIYLSLRKSDAFFYPGIGIRFAKKVKKLFYLTISVQYNYGFAGYDLTYEKRNFFGDTTSTSGHYSQPISALQIQSGIQLRVFKAKRFRHK